MESQNVLTPEELCRYRHMLKRRAQAGGASPCSASDLAQSILLAVLRQEEPRWSIPYLLKALKNKLIDRFYRREREVILSQPNLIVSPDSYRSTLDLLCERMENRAFWAEFFPLLNRRETAIVLLYYFQDCGRSLTCEKLKLKEGQLANSLRTIKKKGELARLRLKGKNNDHGEDI